MPKYEITYHQLASVAGTRQPNTPLIRVAEPRTPFSPESRKGRLVLMIDRDEERDGAETTDACKLVSKCIYQEFYNDSSFSITSSLKGAIRAGNKALYQYNFDRPKQQRTLFGITCAVLKDRDLFIAQIAPCQAYVLTGQQVRALPMPMSWHSAHLSATPFTRANGLGSSLFAEPELYRCMVTPGDMLVLCSSHIAPQLSYQDVLDLLYRQEPQTVLDRLEMLGVANAFPSLHTLIVTLQAPHKRDTRSTESSSDRPKRWWSFFGGSRVPEAPEPPLVVRSSTDVPATETVAPPPPQPTHSVNPPSKPRSIDVGVSLDEQHAMATLVAERAAAAAPSIHRQGAIDLSHMPDIQDNPITNKPAYQPRRRRRPSIDMPWYEHVLTPIRLVGDSIADWTHPRRRERSRLKQLPPVRNETNLSYRQRPPQFQILYAIILVLSVTVLVLYGTSLSQQSTQEHMEENLTLVEEHIDAIWSAPNEQLAQERLEQASQLLGQLEGNPLITETNTAFWMRYQQLQREYEQALGAITRLTFFDNPTIVVDHPVRFTSVVVPPTTVALTSTTTTDATPFVYALGTERGQGILYRIDHTGAIIPYLSPGDVVQNIPVSSIRAITWRIDHVVAVDQGVNAFGYYFRAGDIWNYTRLGGSEIWFPDMRLDLETYEGNLYVWGAEPGEILRFQSGHYGDPPTLWLDPSQLGGYDMTSSLDMAVDGNIYMLQPDNRILVLNAGNFEREIILPPLNPPLTTMTRLAVTGPASMGHIFLLEPMNERLIQIDKMTGQILQQIKINPTSDIRLDELVDFTIVEKGGRPVVYVVNGSQIIRAEVPNPPEPFVPASEPPPPPDEP